MSKEKLINEIEGIIDNLIEEGGGDLQREELHKLALFNIVYGYDENKYSDEDLINAAEYLGFEVDINEIEKGKSSRAR